MLEKGAPHCGTFCTPMLDRALSSLAVMMLSMGNVASRRDGPLDSRAMIRWSTCGDGAAGFRAGASCESMGSPPTRLESCSRWRTSWRAAPRRPCSGGPTRLVSTRRGGPDVRHDTALPPRSREPRSCGAGIAAGTRTGTGAEAMITDPPARASIVVKTLRFSCGQQDLKAKSTQVLEFARVNTRTCEPSALHLNALEDPSEGACPNERQIAGGFEAPRAEPSRALATNPATPREALVRALSTAIADASAAGDLATARHALEFLGVMLAAARSTSETVTLRLTSARDVPRSG